MKRLTALLLAATLGLSAPVATAAPGDGLQRPRAGWDRDAARERRGARDARLLHALEQMDPERHRKVLEIRQARPRLYASLVVQGAQGLRHRARDERAVPRFQEMIDAAWTLNGQLDAFAAADDKARKRLRGEIEQTVGTLFELRQEARRAQLAVMEARLERLRADIDARAANKDDLVETFVDTALDAVAREPGF